MPLLTHAYHLLGFELLINTNDHTLAQIIARELQYYYQDQTDSTHATLHFDLLLNDESNIEGVNQTTLSTDFNPEKEVLTLLLPHGIGKVEIDYRHYQVKAYLLPTALYYVPVLFNWIITIPFAELAKPWGYYFIHAAALTINERSVLFAGKSASGKSTLALMLLSRGWQLITDDEAFLTKTNPVTVYGLSARANLTEQTWQMFASSLGTPPSSAAKVSVDLRQIFPTQILQNGKLSAICLISPAQDIALERLQPITALSQLLNLCFLPAHPHYTRAGFDFFCDLTERLPIYRLHFNLAAEPLSRLLQQEVLA